MHIINSKNTILIEFTGIAGIGKTTIVKQIYKEIHGMNIKTCDLGICHTRKKFRDKLCIESVYRALLLQPKTFKKGLKNYRILNSYSRKMNKCINSSDEVILLDEGIFHKARELQRNSRDNNFFKIIDKLSSYIHFPDYVIVLEADAKTIYNRRVKRNRYKDKFSFELIQDYVDNFSETTQLIEYAKKKYHPSMEIIRLNYDDDMSAEQAASIVLGKIGASLKGNKLDE